MIRDGRPEANNPLRSGCVLLFSGGRDSSVAALRLSREYSHLKLVTVSTEHLFGMNHVICRLGELKRHLDPATRWYHFLFEGQTETGFELLMTCLPCHSVYLLAGLTVAADTRITDIAFGYTQYQSSWAEQSVPGRIVISEIMAQFGCRAIFPVSDVMSKEQAMAELRAHSVTELALEQKCLRQQGNKESDRSSLTTEIARWGGWLRTALKAELAPRLQLVRSLALSEIEEGKSCLPII